MSAARRFLEASIGRTLKSGSLGSIVVDRRGRRWVITASPSYDGRTGIYRAATRDDAKAWIMAWAEHRQTLLGLDIGTYAAEVPANFGPIARR